MGLLLGVARGSSEPPRLLCLTYTPPGGATGPVLGLVGKGITFDTGGISIKPADGMERMKDDMAGGAAVVAAVRAIARLGVPRRVVAVVPAAENMPGGNALKPGDVIRSAAGLTVEVNNTDAEGRLILGDGAVVRAADAARRTWSTSPPSPAPAWSRSARSHRALRHAAGVGRGRAAQAAARAGEPVWELPLGPEYRELLKSEIADMINSAGRAGGAITAAMFLREFAGDTPGRTSTSPARPGWTTRGRGRPKGASGVMVRTLVELAAGDLQ